MAATYPYKNYRFKVEIDNTQVGGFSEVTGFDATFDVIEYRAGDDELTPRKQPGLVKYSNITLKRGVVDAIEFYTWINEIREGNLKRKTVTISLMNDAGSSVITSWTLTNAWPCKYTGPDFNGTGSEVAVESIEFAHEKLVREAGTSANSNA